MKTAGIREARQRLSELLVDVAKGRDVVLTDRGRPVARLTGVHAAKHAPFESRRAKRSKYAALNLSQAVQEDREDRR